jgi:glycine/D-amino acid oxidase-like deaminating enzyme/nitrite reductase/ring-hydroxylating ferredoxin subunit
MRSDTTPYWTRSANAPRFPSLDRDDAFDVVIVGGGITGITAAWLLKRAGRRVAVIERSRCASIDTGHTTAHLTCVTDARLTDLAKAFGRDHACAVWDAGLAAIAQIDECVRTEGIECHFAWVPGYLHAPRGEVTPELADQLKQETELACSLGFDATFLEEVPFVGTPGMEVADQARFHPRKYLAALAAAVDGGGSAIFEETSVEEVTDKPLTVVASGHRVTCDHVIVATHNPIMGKAGLIGPTVLQTKLALYTSYAVAARVPRGSVPDALFWDTQDPYGYLRLDRHDDGDVVIYGGADHKTGQAAATADCFAAVERALRQLIPAADVTEHWSGQVIETNDGLPFIGEMAERQFGATGFSGNGMTFGTLAGMMARDFVLGTPNPWAGLFDMGRTKVRGGLWDYLKENKDYPYYLIRDRFAGADGKSLRAVPRGSGRLLDLNGHRVAAYRDPDGSVTVRSAVCTHMGCHVTWNEAERTWDCPCHGSRFRPSGEVISGPAESPLAEVDRT